MEIIKAICLWHPEYEGFIKEVKPSSISFNNWWYLHGKLESINGYDCAVIYNLDELSDSMKKTTMCWSEIRNGVSNEPNPTWREEIHINGEFPVQVYGVDEECVGFFFTEGEHTCQNIDFCDEVDEFVIWKQRGLICLKSDAEGIAEARECMRKRIC